MGIHVNKKIIVRILIIILAVLVIAFFSNYKVPCIIHEYTGLLCPGCGMTRSLICYLHLDIIGALKYNLLSIIFVYGITKVFVKGDVKFNKIETLLFLASTIIYTIIRNI